MTPALRKLNLTAHLTSSIGWLGAVASFLVLSVAGMASEEADTVRGAYLAMNLIGQFIIVPLSLAAVLTGLVQSLGTHRGLFRHYWGLVKCLLTILAGVALLLHQFTAVAEAARRVAGAGAGTMPNVGRLGIQLVGDAGLAVLLLLVITALGVYKPWGRTRYGRRRDEQERRRAAASTAEGEPTGDGLPTGLKVFLAVIGVLAAAFVVLHLAGGGLGGHGH